MAEKSLILRTCSSNMSSYGGFVWPTSGPVACPDWQPAIACGNGLHGALWGEGDGNLLSFDPDAKWLVVEVDTADIIDLGGKVKFPRGVVVHCGDRLSATAYIQRPGKAVIGGTSTSGYRGTSTSGHGGTSTSGHGGTSTSGDYGTSTSGDRGTSISGDRGTSTSGDYGTSTSGHGGTSTSGDYGTSTSGAYGTSTSGDGGTSTSGAYGTSTSGYGGTSTSGDRGTSTSGDRGTSTSGDEGTSISGHGGIVQCTYYDNSGRRRIVTGYVGENGILPDVAYKCDENGNLVKAG